MADVATQLAELLGKNADLFAAYGRWSDGQIMLLAGTVDDPDSFDAAGGKAGPLGYYPVVNVNGQTLYVPCTERLRSIAVEGVEAAAGAETVARRAIDKLTVRSAPMTIDIARYDMTSYKGTGQQGEIASEGLPHGAKLPATGAYYDWALNPQHGAVAGMYGANLPNGWNAGLAWLQGYYQADVPWLDKNTRIHFRNLQIWVRITSTGEHLCLALERDPSGAGYVEDFSTNSAIGLDQRAEPDGGTSVRMVPGYAYHAYLRQRLLMPVGDIQSVYVSVEARLVLDDPDGPDDRALARYVASSGGDYWRSLTAGNSETLANNGPIMMGRLKKITSDWQTFSACTLSPAQMTSADTLPPMKPDPVHVTYAQQHRSLGRGDIYNGTDRTTAGAVLDARAGKALADVAKSNSDRISVVEASTGGAASRSYYDGVPTVEAAISGKTFFIDAGAPIAFPLPATTTGGMRFSVVQMNAAGPIVFQPRAGATVLGGKTQTNGLFAKYDVLLYRNENGTTAEWMITGSSPLIDAQTAPAQLWTPYQYGADRTDLWVAGGSPQTITTVGGKASRIIDKASKGRTFYQANDTYRPGVANPLNGKAGLVSTIAAPAFMAGVAGTGLTTLTDIFFNGGAFLSATATLSETYSNVPFNAPRIAIFRFSPAGGDIWVNGVRLGGFPDTRAYGFTGMAWLVFNPYSAGQIALGRIYHAGTLGLLGTVPTAGNPDKGIPNRCADMTLWEFGVVNLSSIFLTGTGDSNVDLMNGYLASIYGLRDLLPAANPYKSAAPTIA